MAIVDTLQSLKDIIIEQKVTECITLPITNSSVTINPLEGSFFEVNNINSNLNINITPIPNTVQSTCYTIYLRLNFNNDDIVLNWPSNIKWYEITPPLINTYEDLYTQFTTFNSGDTWISTPLVKTRPKVSLADYMINTYPGKYNQLSDVPEEAYLYFNSVIPTSLNGTFRDCALLERVDVSGIILDKVTSIRGMFSGCREIEYLDLSSFDTKNITDMTELFISCNNLKVVDISNFDTQSIPDTSTEEGYDWNVGGMFRYCNNLNYIIINSNTMKFTPNTNITGSTGLTSSSFNGVHWYGLGLTAENVKILVPRSLLNTYKTHNRWSAVSEKFDAIENYTITKSNNVINVTHNS